MTIKLSAKTITKRLINVARLLYEKDPNRNGYPFSHYLQEVFKCHKLGYLWCSSEGDQVVAALGVHRVPELTDELTDTIPDVEAGKIAYVPFCASVSKDRFVLLHIMREFVKRNQDIEQIAYHDLSTTNDRLKRFQVKKLIGV